VLSAGVQEVLADWRRNLAVAITVAILLSALVLLTLWRQLALLSSLAVSRTQLELLAATDAMTGTLNHTAFMDVLARDFARSRRYGESLTVLMLDIDFFKRINDGYGHAVGDDALRSFARVLKSELRTVDAIGRLGGEEFGIILPNTAGDPAQRLAERLREQIAAIVVKSPRKEEVRFTTSIGLAQMDVDDVDPERLLGRADAALYQAKAHGRNRVEVSRPSPASA
jgi:diguanylate cyclase (GGDEF)-like protein